MRCNGPQLWSNMNHEHAVFGAGLPLCYEVVCGFAIDEDENELRMNIGKRGLLGFSQWRRGLERSVAGRTSALLCSFRVVTVLWWERVDIWGVTVT